VVLHPFILNETIDACAFKGHVTTRILHLLLF